MNDTSTKERSLAIEAIQKKLLGKHLTYKEIFSIMDEISHNALGEILTTYFAASGYAKGFSNEELYFLTQAMVKTGETLHFNGIVADKHSIGGVPGTRTTLIVIPIIAAAGFTIPKSSSRAITTPDGTADDMEVLAPVEFTKEQIYDIVKRTNGCIVWGGSVNIAPADDILIHVEKPLLFESYDKIIVSIMAKKIAFGSNHIVIDLPYGLSVKIHHRNDALVLKEKFEYIARKFNIKLICRLHETHEPVGRGIGPVLETRDALYVLEQSSLLPLDLQERAIDLAATLLDLCLEDSGKSLVEEIAREFGSSKKWARHLLTSGQALEKMKEIVTAQGGSSYFSSTKLTSQLGDYTLGFTSPKSGHVSEINSRNLTTIAKILGAPRQKGSGIFLDKKLGEKIQKGDCLFTMYSQTVYNLKEAKESLKSFPIYKLVDNR